MQSRKAGWPKGRITHEFSSRFDQAWSQLTAIVFNEYTGQTVELPIDHFHCTATKDCSGIVRLDSRGFAACEICGKVYNDGASWMARKGEHGHSHLNKFIDSCKA